jgi:glycosyltransferase involved in cell wall biosynthesis
LGIDQHAAVAVAVARLTPEKNLDRFIRAVSAVEIADRQVIGVIVGDGPERNRLERVVTEQPGKIRLVGFDDNPSRWIRAADVVCLTSELEAHPLSLIEGMACGRPFVAMDAGSAGTMANSGSVGLVVSQADEQAFSAALTRLLSDEELCSAMGRDARSHWNAEYSHGLMVDRYATLLRTGPVKKLGAEMPCA